MTYPLSTPTAKMSRLDWLKLRQTGIGGSDISAIMGLNNYKTGFDVYNEKKDILTEIDEDTEEYLYWGNALESVIAKEFEKRSGMKIQNVNFMMRHPEYNWAIANIDRAIINPEISGNVRFKDGQLTTDAILEVKTCNEFLRKEWGRENTDEIPDAYLCQVQWYMAITNTQICHVAVLIGGNKYKTYKVERNDELIESLLEAGKEFWENHIMAGVEPDPTNLDDAKQKWKQHRPNTVLQTDSDSDLAKKFAEYITATQKEKILKNEIESLKFDLTCGLQDNEALAIDGQVVLTYKTQSRVNLDNMKILKDHPDLVAPYLKESVNRVMRIK